MSRELRPVEICVCRMVFALLGIIVLAFVVLSAIDFLFDPWPRARNVQSRPVVQSPPLIQSQIAQSQKSSRRGALADQPAGIALLRKEMQSQTPGSALDRAIRFDPGLLDRRVYGTSYIDADALPNASATGTLQSGPQQEIFTAALASAEPAVSYRSEESLAQSSASNRQGQPIEVAVGAAASSREDVQQIQSRLRDLGYLSSAATGIWDLKSRDALRDFKLINRLANSDTLDVETSEKLSSQTAIRAHQSFIGSWSAAPCSSTKTKDLRVTISSRRIRASTGSICEIHGVQSENSGWRVRANCSQGTQHWTANGRFAVRGEKLIWTSERDVINYFRCN